MFPSWAIRLTISSLILTKIAYDNNSSKLIPFLLYYEAITAPFIHG
jgi:hypothetical protein